MHHHCYFGHYAKKNPPEPSLINGIFRKSKSVLTVNEHANKPDSQSLEACIEAVYDS